MQQQCDGRAPSGLVRRADAAAGIAVVIFVEQHEVVGVIELRIRPHHRPPAIGPLQRQRKEPPRQPQYQQGYPQQQPQYQQPQYAPPPPQYAPGYQPGMFQQRGSGFLGTALTTAAGEVIWSPWYLAATAVIGVVLTLTGLLAFRRSAAYFAEYY